MQFPHEKLAVYQKALDFFGGIQRHIIRAAESVLFNLVEGVRLHATEKMVSKREQDGCLSCFSSIVNCLANSSETNSVGNFAENYFEGSQDAL